MTEYRVSRNSKQCIEAFLYGVASQAGRLHTEGSSLWSYGLEIAQNQNKGKGVRVLDRKHALKPDGSKSPTTSKHIGLVHQLCDYAVTVESL